MDCICRFQGNRLFALIPPSCRQALPVLSPFAFAALQADFSTYHTPSKCQAYFPSHCTMGAADVKQTFHKKRPGGNACRIMNHGSRTCSGHAYTGSGTAPHKTAASCYFPMSAFLMVPMDFRRLKQALIKRNKLCPLGSMFIRIQNPTGRAIVAKNVLTPAPQRPLGAA